jgi:hypothetical protein
VPSKNRINRGRQTELGKSRNVAGLRASCAVSRGCGVGRNSLLAIFSCPIGPPKIAAAEYFSNGNLTQLIGQIVLSGFAGDFAFIQRKSSLSHEPSLCRFSTRSPLTCQPPSVDSGDNLDSAF